MVEAHVGLGEVPPGDYQQFIVNEKFVYLIRGWTLTLPLSLPLGGHGAAKSEGVA
jgi:hypothetical protein